MCGKTRSTNSTRGTSSNARCRVISFFLFSFFFLSLSFSVILAVLGQSIEEISKQLIVEALYLDREDLKQSKSNGEKIFFKWRENYFGSMELRLWWMLENRVCCGCRVQCGSDSIYCTVHHRMLKLACRVYFLICHKNVLVSKFCNILLWFVSQLWGSGRIIWDSWVDVGLHFFQFFYFFQFCLSWGWVGYDYSWAVRKTKVD